MKLSKKDIKKEFFASSSPKGELTPILYKRGKYLIPTSEGLKEVKTNKKER